MSQKNVMMVVFALVLGLTASAGVAEAKFNVPSKADMMAARQACGKHPGPFAFKRHKGWLKCVREFMKQRRAQQGHASPPSAKDAASAILKK